MIHATLDPSDLNKDVAVDYALIGDAKLIWNLSCWNQGQGEGNEVSA